MIFFEEEGELVLVLVVEGRRLEVPEEEATALGSWDGLSREASSLVRAALWT